MENIKKGFITNTPAIPDISLRYIVENPRWIQRDPNVDAEAKRYTTLIADRDLALSNHFTAGLALATVLHWLVLEDPIAEYDKWAWVEYRAWLQLLKSIHGHTLQAALQRIRGEAVFVPVGITQNQQPEKTGLLNRIANMLRGG